MKQNTSSKIVFILIVFLGLGFLFLPNKAFSATGNSGTEKVQLSNPLTGQASYQSVPVIIGEIIKTFLEIIGSIALLVFVVGGVRLLFSRGQQEQIKKGGMTMLYAVIGLAVIFGSYVMLNFMLNTVIKGDGSSGGGGVGEMSQEAEKIFKENKNKCKGSFKNEKCYQSKSQTCIDGNARVCYDSNNASGDKDWSCDKNSGKGKCITECKIRAENEKNWQKAKCKVSSSCKNSPTQSGWCPGGKDIVCCKK